MVAIMHIEMRKNLQDKGLLFWMLILPIIFTVLFIAVFTSGMEPTVQKEIIASIIPGYIVMFVFFIMISMVTTFIKDRDHGMTARLASTPLSPTRYLLGKWMPYIWIVFIQMFVLFCFGKLIYNISLGKPLLLVILALFLAFTVTGLGLALALFANTENMGIAVTQVIGLGGAMLGGLWIPFDMMPSILQTIGKFLPQYWAHQAFQETMAETIIYSEFLLTILILFGFGFGGFILAFIQFPNFLKRARS